MIEDYIPYLDEIPVEHAVPAPGGGTIFTELGVIYLCTLVEQRQPEKAAAAARFRRVVSARIQELREQSNSDDFTEPVPLYP